jgi:hypothetical protein
VLVQSLFFAWAMAVWDALQSIFWPLERGVYAGLPQGSDSSTRCGNSPLGQD